MISKEHSDIIYDTLEQIKKHVPGLYVRISDLGIELYNNKKLVHTFTGTNNEQTLTIMSTFLGIQLAFKMDPTLKQILKQL